MALVTSFALGLAVGYIVTWPFVRRAKPVGLNGMLASEVKPQPKPDTAWHSTPDSGCQSTAIIVMDRLEHIDGIVPSLARRLNQAGILTYTDLATQSPERLRAILDSAPLPQSNSTREIDVEAWQKQARALADRLTNGKSEPAP